MSKKSYDVYRQGEFLRRVELFQGTPAEARKWLIACGSDSNIQVKPAREIVMPPVSKNFDQFGNKLKNWQKKRPPVTLTTGH